MESATCCGMELARSAVWNHHEAMYGINPNFCIQSLPLGEGFDLSRGLVPRNGTSPRRAIYRRWRYAQSASFAARRQTLLVCLRPKGVVPLPKEKSHRKGVFLLLAAETGYSPKANIFTSSLVSKLPDDFRSNANPFPRVRSGTECERTSSDTTRKNDHRMMVVFLV